MKCPKCDSTYTRKGVCGNTNCDFSYVKPPEISTDWKSLIGLIIKLTTYTPRDVISYFRCGFRGRHRVNTGFKFGDFPDTDQMIENSMMNLVVKYVEEELGLINYYENSNDDSTLNEINKTHEVFELYRDIKVTLPRLIHRLDTVRTVWANDYIINWTDDGEHDDLLRMTPTYNDTDEVEKKRWGLLQKTEDEHTELVNDILMRIVKWRGIMWN